MRCKYPNRDLVQRLDTSVCRYDGRAVYVRYAGDGDLLNLWYLPTNRKGASDLTIHARFDISTVPMGYMQIDNVSVAYALRRPGRIYKQGVSYDNVHFNMIDGKHVNYNPSIYEDGFKCMVEDKYPALKTVMSTMRKSSLAMQTAVSRDIALAWDPAMRLIYVYYKTDQVGFIVDNTNTVIIPSSEKAWVVSKFLYGLDWEIQ